MIVLLVAGLSQSLYAEENDENPKEPARIFLSSTRKENWPIEEPWITHRWTSLPMKLCSIMLISRSVN